MKNNPDRNTIIEASQYKMLSRQKSRFEAVQDVYKLRGFGWLAKYFLTFIFSLLFSRFWSFYYRLDFAPDTLAQDTFIFHSLDNKKFQYFHHSYNTTWSNERRIEIPLIRYYMTGIDSSKILELGNVMSHYIKAKHDIVDEYEYEPEVINVDILKYNPKKKYDLIISVSTLEHIGVDGEKEPGKALKTIEHLRTLLSQKGKIIFTIPTGYNRSLDNSLKNNTSLLSKAYYFKRITSDNKWVEVDKYAGYWGWYGFPYKWGNQIVLGIIENKSYL